jgi:hypothetical protein
MASSPASPRTGSIAATGVPTMVVAWFFPASKLLFLSLFLSLSLFPSSFDEAYPMLYKAKRIPKGGFLEKGQLLKP